MEKKKENFKCFVIYDVFISQKIASLTNIPTSSIICNFFIHPSNLDLYFIFPSNQSFISNKSTIFRSINNSRIYNAKTFEFKKTRRKSTDFFLIILRAIFILSLQLFVASQKKKEKKKPALITSILSFPRAIFYF